MMVDPITLGFTLCRAVARAVLGATPDDLARWPACDMRRMGGVPPSASRRTLPPPTDHEIAALYDAHPYGGGPPEGRP